MAATDMPSTPTADDGAADRDERDVHELQRMSSDTLAEKAKALEEQVRNSQRRPSKGKERTPEAAEVQEAGAPPGRASQRSLVTTTALDEKQQKEAKGHDGHHKKKGAFAGVFVPTCENMWGVLIFLRFFTIVGQAGIGQALCAVFLSFCCAFCTTSSMSATVSSGGLVSKGGPYYMISRALGPCVGASVGIMYWLAITMLAVLETLGAVEGILMAAPEAEFTFCKQAYGSGLLLALVLFVYGGISLVTRLGIFFVFVVFFTLYIYYHGLIAAPYSDAAMANPDVTGLSFETAKENWYSHYTDGHNFGYVLSVFFPCFTGILSGANRADILRDPPKNLRHGTFGAIIFSLFMYSSYMVLWGMVAKYSYLQGLPPSNQANGRRLAGGGAAGARIVEEIIFNPFPKAAIIGIIVSSLSQALQCIVVAPRLLQSIAKDEIISFLNKLAPLTNGEPKRALFATYLIAGLMVMIGQLDIVAPLLSMCFLVAYAFMNISCFMLTWLKSPAWRPTGIHKKRWRAWYLSTSGGGFVIALTIMFTINHWWALAALGIALALYVYVSWKVEEKGWGSATDGIRYQLALNSLIQLEASQHHHVNWRPQILILYRIHLTEELEGIKHHEILRFYSQLRKGNGFCVVACVLESDCRDEHAIHKARIEKGVIQSIMKEESIQGFAEVVVAPSWVEGTNYIIQLTGIGGLSPNTVLLDWPENWRAQLHKATDFVNILRTALAEDKAVLAMRGLASLPDDTCFGTIDIWWMIHDGGFLILLSWLLVQHKTWRKCHLRVFTITEGVSEEEAQAAAELLTKTLRQRRLFDVDVEVILADDEMIEPYTYDWTLRVEDRHKFLEQLGKQGGDVRSKEAIPLEIDDLFSMEAMTRKNTDKDPKAKDTSLDKDDDKGTVSVSDVRLGSKVEGERSTGMHQRGASSSSRTPSEAPKADVVNQVRNIQLDAKTPVAADGNSGAGETSVQAPSKTWGKAAQQPSLEPPSPGGQGRPSDETTGAGEGAEAEARQPPKSPNNRSAPILDALVGQQAMPDLNLEEATKSGRVNPMRDNANAESFTRLNQIIHTRSKRAQLVVMNLPDLWGTEPEEVRKFMTYCDTLTKGLERVLFVHSSGHEIFDLSI